MPVPTAGFRLAGRAVLGVAFSALLILVAVAITFFVQHALAINRLTRGVGDTMFFTAAGAPWFRMDEQRRDAPLQAISGHLREAVVAVEDHRFARHPGLDPIALGRAAFRNLREPGTVEGGSTVTQQLARTLFLSNSRTYGRKLKEAALALMLEAQLTKDQILELYLNRIYLGGDIYGVESMTRRLFNKPSRDVTLAEAALIAGLIRAPSALSPWANLEDARRRSFVVLARMRAEGFITADEEQSARTARLRVRPYVTASDAKAGYAKELLRQEFRNRFGGDHPPDWQVHTTFIPEVQELAERSVENGLRRLGIANLQAALVAIDPVNGNLLAVVGGRDFRMSAFNRARRSRRQPGSAFKPFVYAAALERGFTPVSLLTNLSTVQPIGTEEWTPRNAGGEAPDVLTLREALFESNNRAAVALQQRIGSRPVIALTAAAGLHDMPDVPSLSLGTGLVTPIELTAAYATFPNGGLAVRPRAITRVIGARQEIVQADPIQAERILSEQTAFQIVTLLRDVVDRGTATAVRAAGLRGPLAGKTGTTDDFKDAWFVGFSSTVVVGVWVGHDQPATIARNGYGSRLALPIWIEFMQRTSRLLPARAFVEPPGLVVEPLCRVSYLRPVDGCPTYNEYFKEGDELPDQQCPVHRGSFKQRTQRAVEGFLRGLGRRIGGIFKW